MENHLKSWFPATHILCIWLENYYYQCLFNRAFNKYAHYPKVATILTNKQLDWKEEKSTSHSKLPTSIYEVWSKNNFTRVGGNENEWKEGKLAFNFHWTEDARNVKPDSKLQIWQNKHIHRPGISNHRPKIGGLKLPHLRAKKVGRGMEDGLRPGRGRPVERVGRVWGMSRPLTWSPCHWTSFSPIGWRCGTRHSPCWWSRWGARLPQPRRLHFTQCCFLRGGDSQGWERGGGEKSPSLGREGRKVAAAPRGPFPPSRAVGGIQKAGGLARAPWGGQDHYRQHRLTLAREENGKRRIWRRSRRTSRSDD